MKRQKPIDIVLGNNIAERRLAFGFSRVVLANKLGVTHQQLGKYENGMNRVSSATLFELANIFKCTTDELLLLNDHQVDTHRTARTIHMVKVFNTLTDKQRIIISDVAKMFAKNSGKV